MSEEFEPPYETVPKERKIKPLATVPLTKDLFQRETLSQQFTKIDEKDYLTLLLIHEKFSEVIDDSHEEVGNILKGRAYETSPLAITLTKFVSINEFEKHLLKSKELKDSSNVFTRAIQWLLTLLSFQAIKLDEYEHFRIPSGVTIGGLDILGYDMKSWNLLAVNCSISPPNPSELDKFVELIGRLKPGYGPSFIIKPLYFVSSEAKMTKRQGEEAGIKVLDIADIRKLFEILKIGDFEKGRRYILS